MRTRSGINTFIQCGQHPFRCMGLSVMFNAGVDLAVIEQAPSSTQVTRTLTTSVLISIGGECTSGHLCRTL
jgi:hypothetical protein